jgi:hypothetical protein
MKGANRKKEYDAAVKQKWEQISAEFERDFKKEKTLILLSYLSERTLESLGGQIDAELMKRRGEKPACKACGGRGVVPSKLQPGAMATCAACEGRG